MSGKGWCGWRSLIVMLWSLGAVLSAQAASQCTATFAYPVQSHVSPGVLSMSGGTKVYGNTDSTYPFLSKSIQGQADCNGGGYWNNSGIYVSTCNVTGSLAPSISGLSFPSDPGGFTTDPGDSVNISGLLSAPCTQLLFWPSWSYGSTAWSTCSITLVSGQSYYVQSLTLTGSAQINLNGATLYVGDLTINGYGAAITGSGAIYANNVTVQGDGKLKDANVTAYQSVNLSVNTNTNVTAVFQPHYLTNMTLSAQSYVSLAAGTWSVNQLTMSANSQLSFQGASTLNLYNLTMSSGAVIAPASGARTDLAVNLYQTLNMADNALITGYLQAKYLSTFIHTSTSAIPFYFSGGTHLIKTLTLNSPNDTFYFDSATPADLYINSGLTLSGEMKVNYGNDANNLMIVSFGAVSMATNAKLNAMLYVTSNDFTMTDNSRFSGAVSARNVSMTINAQISYQAYTGNHPAVCGTTMTCFTDDFSSNPLSTADWITSVSSGAFTPINYQGRLRMTQADNNLATAVTLQRLFPASGNLITVEMDAGAWNGSGGDGLAMVLSDAGVTPKPGAFGGPLGYGFKTGINGFAGGWLGVGLDEYGNYSNQGGTTNPGFISNAVAVRGSGTGTSGYRYLSGTTSLSPGISSGTSYPSPARRYRLTVDTQTSGKALVKVERSLDSGSSYSTLIGSFDALAQTGQSALPSNFFLSLTSSTGGSTNIHEIDNLKVCALKTTTNSNPIDHFEYSYSGTPLTCTPQTLTLYACADSSCSTLYTGTTTATLSATSDGNWTSGSSVTLTNGTATVSLSKPTTGAVTIDVSGSSPSAKPYSTTLCRQGSATATSAACTLTFADSGFLLSVPDQTANKPVAGTIQAVRKSDNSASCVPAFASVTRTVNFWSGYSNPTSTVNTAAPAIKVNGTAIGKSSAATTALSLAFDATGKAALTSVNYTDAGEMILNASYSGSSANNDSGLTLTGNDTFVSAPAGICIAPATTCSAGDASCPAFKRAGETFSVSLTPVAWESDSDTDLCTGNAVTPNFALSGIALGSTLLAPSGGAAASLAVSRYDHVASASATQTVSQSLSEVGVFRLTATPPTYLGVTIPASQSAPVGRITPYDFYLSGGALTPACNADFSYMDQPFGVTYTLTARNSSGATTTNYTGSFAKGTTALVAENGDDGVDRSSRLSTISASWSKGIQSVSAAPVTFSRLAETTPDGPFSSLAVGVSVAANDTLSAALTNADMNPATAGTCTTCTAGKLGTQRLLAGRLNAGSARGAPESAQVVPLQLEYWSGTAWTRNTADSCSQLVLGNSGGFLFDRTWNASTRTLTLANSASSVLGLSASRDTSGTASATAQSGYLWLHFSAPGVNDRVHYQVGLAAQSPASSWLRYDWNGDGTAAQDESGGWVFFNRWRGSDRIIYRREAW